MRLVEYGQREDYQPLERGEAFPQFYETGDKFSWYTPWDWSYSFWLYGTIIMERHYNDFDPMWLMGGEL